MRVPVTCPKCQRERLPGKNACVRCGLLVTRWEGFAVVEPTLPALDEPWAELERKWEDAEAHHRFLDLAATLDGLDVAAARYRRINLLRPDDERAQVGLRQAAERAQRLYVTRAQMERPPRAPAILKLLGTMFAGLILLAALWAVATALRFRH
jgi:hypothetical protein